MMINDAREERERSLHAAAAAISIVTHCYYCPSI